MQSDCETDNLKEIVTIVCLLIQFATIVYKVIQEYRKTEQRVAK